MTDQVRAKFRLSGVTYYPDTTAQTLKFQVHYDPSIPEDQKFTKYTPTGQIEMHVDNPTAQQMFKVGEYYYVDFTPVAS